jgi:hypothetical protein
MRRHGGGEEERRILKDTLTKKRALHLQHVTAHYANQRAIQVQSGTSYQY